MFLLLFIKPFCILYEYTPQYDRRYLYEIYTILIKIVYEIICIHKVLQKFVWLRSELKILVLRSQFKTTPAEHQYSCFVTALSWHDVALIYSTYSSSYIIEFNASYIIIKKCLNFFTILSSSSEIAGF